LILVWTLEAMARVLEATLARWAEMTSKEADGPKPRMAADSSNEALRSYGGKRGVSLAITPVVNI
jgi:hypothetical protein